MKLKLVVATMSVLGLVSTSLFAADTATTQTTTTQTTTTAKAPVVKHHHKARHVVRHHHPRVVAERTSYHSMENVAIQPAPVTIETEPKVDTYGAILDAMNHNTGRAKPMPDWFNRIGVSGGANVDFKWGNRRPTYTTENVQRIALNDIYLNVNGSVNDWAKAFVGLSYNSTSVNYSYVYPANTFTVEQAYVTLGNLDVNPVFLQVGKQYQDFGRYVIHPLNRTLAQSLSETLRTSANLGFVTRMGLHGSIYAYDDAVTVAGVGHAKTALGASLGFDHPNDQLGYDVGLGYVSNMASVNDVRNFLAGNVAHRVGAIAAYGDVNSGPFDFGVRYVTALSKFSASDLNTNATLALGTGNGAQPWAVDATAGYSYNYWNKDQNLYVGYQASGKSVRLGLPKNRVLVGLNVDMWKNTVLGAEYTHDNGYRASLGGTGKSFNTFGLRAGVKLG